MEAFLNKQGIDTSGMSEEDLLADIAAMQEEMDAMQKKRQHTER